MGDEYLDKLAKIKRKSELKNYKTVEKGRKDIFKDEYKSDIFLRGEKLLRDDNLIRDEPEYAMTVANELISYKQGNKHSGRYAFLGAKLYEKLGRGNAPSVKKRLFLL